MRPWLGESFGNAHSLHAWGREASAVVERAREQVARAVGRDPGEVTFTSGATEAANTIIASLPSGEFSQFEHSAVRDAALRAGWTPCRNDGWSNHFQARVAALMVVNNEIGAVWRTRPAGVKTWVADASQALGKIDLVGLDAEALILSGHKISGPMGVGCIVSEIPFEPLLVGGDQEWGRRSGTLPVASIVGLGMAAELAANEREDDWRRAAECRSVLLDGLQATPDWRCREAPQQIQHIVSLSFAGIEGETLVVEADAAGFGISAGAACSSHAHEPSHVLEALGVPESLARGTIRVSFGRWSTPSATRDLAITISQAVERLRQMA